MMLGTLKPALAGAVVMIIENGAVAGFVGYVPTVEAAGVCDKS